MIAPVALMLVGCVAAWAVVAAVLGADVGRDVALGMSGPFAAVAVTWVLVVRAHRRDPAAVTSVLLTAFVGKLIFFGVFIVAIWTAVRPEPTPFIASFTGSFLTLYAVEAVLLGRLSRGGPRT